MERSEIFEVIVKHAPVIAAELKDDDGLTVGENGVIIVDQSGKRGNICQPQGGMNPIFYNVLSKDGWIFGDYYHSDGDQYSM